MARLLAASMILLFAGPALADDTISPDSPPVSPPVRRGGGRRQQPQQPARTTATTPTTTRSNNYLPPIGNDMPEGGPAPHAEGAYGGVAPDQAHPTDGKPGKPKRMPAKGTLTWVGFEPKNGGAEVFFQSVAPFIASQALEGSTLVVLLSGLSRQVVNTRRPIDTHFFDNPLAMIHAHAVGAARATKTRAAHGAGIEVRIAFKNPKDARTGDLRSTIEADGMSYVYLTFPEGADQPATAPSLTPAGARTAPSPADTSVDDDHTPPKPESDDNPLAAPKK